MKKVIIIGGHGKVALLLAPILTKNGWTVTSVIRNAAQIDDVAATGATPVLHDVASASIPELEDLLAGHDGVIWAAGAGGGNPERTYAVDRDAAKATMDAAARAGVDRFIMISYLGAGPDHGVPKNDNFYAYAEAKAAADAHLMGTQLEWTILAPGRLTLEAPTGRIDPTPAAQRTAGSSNDTSRANVALVAAQVLERAGTILRTIEFSDGEIPIEEALTP